MAGTPRDPDEQRQPKDAAWRHSSPFGRSRVAFSRIIDGLDHTVLIAEVVQGDGLDIRGAYLTPFPGASHYMSRFTPNGTRDIYGVVGSGTGLMGDQIPFSAFCVSTSDLPCNFDAGRLTAFAGSRSRHTGGVHTLRGSGAVRFVSQKVDAAIWIAIHSIDGREASVE